MGRPEALLVVLLLDIAAEARWRRWRHRLVVDLLCHGSADFPEGTLLRSGQTTVLSVSYSRQGIVMWW